MGVVNVLSTIVASLLVDRVGRRPLLLWGTAGMVLSLLILSLVFALNPAHVGGLTLLMLLCYIVVSTAVHICCQTWTLVVSAALNQSGLPAFLPVSDRLVAQESLLKQTRLERCP